MKEMINDILGIGSECMFEDLCKLVPYCEPNVLEHTIQLAVEIAREGREGRKIGTMFVLGDEEITLKESRPFILDPLQGHSPEAKGIQDSNMRETAKELAQLDGAFIISSGGVVISAARYINADSTGINIPLGLGARHVAAAAITRRTKSIAVVVSESSVVRVFSRGRIVAEIIPEIWMLGRESIRVQGPYTEAKVGDLQIFACELPKDGQFRNEVT
jgi:DNA integrity scanning protein DisA with diadenylate cyclase activity